MRNDNARTVAGAGGAGRPGQGLDKHSTGRPIEEVLSRLDGVLEHRDGYRAFSPFQERRRARTLAIREGDDGRVLLHDFGGREVPEIVAAIGLTLSDLFPPRPNSNTPHRHPKPWRPKISPRDALEILSIEAHVLAIFGSDVLQGKEISLDDLTRAQAAVARINAVREAVG